MKIDWDYGGRGILWQFDDTAPGTWVGHGSLCIIFVLIGIAIGAWLGDAQYGGLIGATIGLLVFLHREERDKQAKLRDDLYDQQARDDRVGDLIASAFIYVTALVMYFA